MPTELPCLTLFSALKGKGGEAKQQVLWVALPPQPALQPLQLSRQSQPARLAPPLPQLQGLPRFPWQAQQLLQPQLQLQASQLSPMTNLCR